MHRSNGLLLAMLAVATLACSRAPDPAEDLGRLEAQVGGRIGVWAEDLATGATLAWRADERFAFASTFKPLLVAAVLAEAEAGRIALDDRVALAGIEIQPHSPVVGPRVGGEPPTLAELCAAAVTISDNSATNLLFDRVGGPGGLTAFLRAHGDATTRFDRYEVALNTNLPGDPRDTTSPRALAGSYARAVTGDMLDASARQRLADWLVASRTGLERLRAGLPAHWRVGDKTGSGANGAVNNVAIAWPPDGGPLVIAVLMSGSDADLATLNAAHADIARLVVKHLGMDR